MHRPIAIRPAVALLAVFGTGVFAAVALSSPPCGSKRGLCIPIVSTTAPSTTVVTTTPTTTTTAATTTTPPPTATTTTAATTTAAATPTASTTTTATTTTAATTTTTTATPAPDAPTIVEQMTTPEGAKILVYSDSVGWTAQQIYDLLKPNAYQLSLIGPTLTVKVTAQYPSAETSGVSQSNGVYTNYHATMYLQASSLSSFTMLPDDIVAHEYGHAWTLYHLYLSQNGDWSAWLHARGLTGDSRLGSSYMWSKVEMIAEDYRMLFGTQAAQGESAQMNYQIPDARTVAGLKNFFTSVWGS